MSTLNSRERAGAGLAAGSVLLVGGSVAASSLLAGYPVLGGQAVRYLAAGLLLAAWARLRRQPLPRPAGPEWAWLAALAVVGLAGCSVLMIQATRVADPASVGVIIGAAPLIIIIVAALTAGRRPSRRILLAAVVVTAGSAAAQLGAGAGGAGPAWDSAGLLWAAGALGGVVGSTLLAAPLLPRLGALAVTVYACALAGLLLLAAAAVAWSAGGPPILRTPTATQLAALAYLTIAITAVVFIAWYGAMERLGTDRTGLFNGLIPVTSLAAVMLTGTGTITPLRLLGALAVLAGVILGLSRARQVPAGPGLAVLPVPPEQVGVHDPAVPLAQRRAGLGDAGGDLAERPGDQHLVRRAEVRAPEDVQARVIEGGRGERAVQHDHGAVEPFRQAAGDPAGRGDVDRLADPVQRDAVGRREGLDAGHARDHRVLEGDGAEREDAVDDPEHRVVERGISPDQERAGAVRAELVLDRLRDEDGAGLVPVVHRTLVPARRERGRAVARRFGDVDHAVPRPGDMPAQDLVPGVVQPGPGAALVDAEEHLHPVEGRHGLDGELVRVARAHADDQQLAHPPSVPH
jgi:drug/metabolite transporter (DMT)-like permease